MAPSRFGLNPQKVQEQSGENLDLFRFVLGFSGPDFAKISALALRIFWYHLELRRPTFDRFRDLFLIFFHLFDAKNMKTRFFLFIFKRTCPETMLKLQISGFPRNSLNPELCTTNSDRLGENTRFIFHVCCSHVGINRGPWRGARRQVSNLAPIPIALAS